MSSHDINPEWKLIAIGRGSFATVSVLLGRSVAFKHVMLSDRTPELKHSAAYMIPATLIHSSRFHVHSVTMTQQFPQALSSDSSPISKGWSRARPLVAEDDFKALNLGNATYAMDQVLPLPLSTALLIRRLFYPHGQDMATVPSLCRLYFGKVIHVTSSGGRPSRFSTLQISLWMYPGTAAFWKLRVSMIIQL
jgi:hypothetical protein